MLVLGGLAAVLTVWGVYLANLWFGFRPVAGGESSAPERNDPRFYLALALLTTLVVVPWILWRVRRARYLAAKGAQVEGRVLKVGAASRYGLTPVTFAYSVDGVDYTRRKDIVTQIARRYDDATRVRVIYDPRNPRRCVILSSAE